MDAQWPLPFKDTLDHRTQFAPGRRPHNRIDLPDLIEDFLLIALRQTSGRNEHPGTAAFFVLCHLKQCIHTLLFGIVNKAACIHNNNIRLCLIIRQRIAAFRQHSKHDLRVHEIFIAAQGHKVYIHSSPQHRTGFTPGGFHTIFHKHRDGHRAYAAGNRRDL